MKNLFSSLILFVYISLFFQSFPSNSVRAQQQGNFNHTTTTLSQARSRLAATSSGELVFFGGGQILTVPSDRVDIYNVTSGSWRVETLSLPRWDLAATSSQNLVFFGGGRNGTSTYSNRVDIYNTLNGSWSIATLSQARCCLAATSVGNLVLFGGGSDYTNFFKVVDVLNVTSNTWTTASLSDAAYFFAATSVDNRYALFGGGGVSYKIIDIFDSLSGMWNTTTLSQARFYLAATSLGNLAFFGGGKSSGGSASKVVDIFNSTSQTWSASTLSQARYQLAASSIGEIVAFGGGWTGSTYSSIVDMLNVTSNIWFTVNLSQPRSWLASTSLGNKIFFGGGEISTNAYSDNVDIFEVPLPPPPPPTTPTTPTTPPPTPLSPPVPQTQLPPSNSPFSQPISSPVSVSTSLFPSPLSSTSSTLTPLSNSPLTSPFSEIPTAPLSDSEIDNSVNTTGTVDNQNGISLAALVVAILVSVLIVASSVVLVVIFVLRKRRKQKQEEQKINPDNLIQGADEESKGVVLPLSSPRPKRRTADILANIKDLESTFAMEGVDEDFIIPYSNLVIDDELGKGEFGKVLIGQWKNRPVAIKYCNEESDTKEFYKEANIMIHLPPHPNIVQVLGVSKYGNRPMLILEYCGGGSLDRLLFDTNVPLDRTQVYHLILGIARGMFHLQKNGIVHRDLAARNILLTEDGTPKVADFGMSRVLQQDMGRTMNNVGPIRWMAPESLVSQVYSHKTDVWMFGMVVWEILMRKEPHVDKDPNQLVKILSQGVTPEIPENCDVFFRRIMERCWQKDPSQRPDFGQLCLWLESGSIN